MRKPTKKEIELKKTKKALVKKFMPKGQVEKPVQPKSNRLRLTDEEVSLILTHRNNPTFEFNIGYKIPKPYLKGKKENILVIGDTHFPFEREGYLEFCRETQEKYQAGRVVHIGDECDNHAISYHESDPDGYSAGNEAELAQAKLNIWYKVFPKVDVMVGNHSSLPFRQAMTAGLPKRFIKAYEELWNAPRDWKWHLDMEIFGVYFVHGTGAGGDRACINRAMNRRQSVVQGHLHSISSVTYNASHIDCIWGMQVGCGVDDNAYALSYAKTNIKKSIISCGIVLDKGQTPLIVKMNL